MSGLTIDSGGLIAFDRNDRAVVAIFARARGHTVLTSDPDDLHRLDPSLKVIRA